MKINRENIDNSIAMLKMVIEKSDYEKNVADKLREYRMKMALPGFRPGKVPAGIIQKRFGKSLVAEEVNQLLGKGLTDYFRDEKISLIGDPLPNETLQKPLDFDTQEEFEFVFDIAISPDIKVDFSQLPPIPYYNIEVSDEMLAENLEQIKSQYGQMGKAEEVTKDAYIRADLAELDAEGNEKEDGIKTEQTLIAIDRIKNEDILNEFLGKTVDSTLTFNPVTAFENRNEIGHMLNIDQEKAETLDSNFKCTITEIEIFEKAKVDEELFKKAYGEDTDVKTEDQFLEKITEEIKEQLKESSDNRFEIDARESLVEAIPIEIPEAFLKRWLKETDKQLGDEDLNAEFENFVRDLRWQLIRNSLVKENHIEVGEEEVEDMAKGMALSQFRQYGYYNIDDKNLESFADRMLENEETRERIVRRIFDIKTFDFIREHAKLDEKEITADQFKDLYKKAEEVTETEDKKEEQAEETETA